MKDVNLDDIRVAWDRLAADWHVQVGDLGDSNRRLNSDPVLWALAGDVAGCRVLDAGCGTGYLTRQLEQKGARVRGVDLSPCMIEIARAACPGIDFQVDDCQTLATVGDAGVDLVVSNYLLMDLPDLDAALAAFWRVLAADGAAVVVFSHPCFPQALAELTGQDGPLSYHWGDSYFQERRCLSPPWAHFHSGFIWFHRPLSDYWKAFRAAGFQVEAFEEPFVTPARRPPDMTERTFRLNHLRPCSVAFRLRKHTVVELGG